MPCVVSSASMTDVQHPPPAWRHLRWAVYPASMAGSVAMRSTLPKDQPYELVCGAFSLCRSTLHGSLGVDGGMLSTEEHPALPYLFIATERCILPDAIVRIGDPKQWALMGQRLRGFAVPEGTEPWKN